MGQLCQVGTPWLTPRWLTPCAALELLFVGCCPASQKVQELSHERILSVCIGFCCGLCTFLEKPMHIVPHHGHLKQIYSMSLTEMKRLSDHFKEAMFMLGLPHRGGLFCAPHLQAVQ
jgi:hypothetical protein